MDEEIEKGIDINKYLPKDVTTKFFILGAVLILVLVIISAVLGAAITNYTMAKYYQDLMVSYNCLPVQKFVMPQG